MQKCWNCAGELNLPQGRVAFRALCDGCGAWIHTCAACSHYHPGAPNSCRIPNTDPITDREKANYCEEFALANESVHRSPSIGDVTERLFGENPKKTSQTKNEDPFSKLFKDEADD